MSKQSIALNKSMAIAAVLPTFLMAAALSSQALAQAAPNDKWVTVVVATEPTDLDGCQSRRDFQGRVVKQNVVETLVQTDPKNNYALRPRLATSWERVDDRTWRFKLRQGVKFHDGATFDAKAVLSSIKRTVSQPYCSDKALLQGFTMEGTAIDDHTIEFKTSRPEPVLPLRLSGVSIVSPNTAPDKISLAPVGTGPFVFDKWMAGQQITLKRNDAYWGKQPQAEGARYLWRAESAVRASMVKIGEADIAVEVNQQDSIERETDPARIKSKSFTTVNGSFFLRLDSSQAPLNDRRVRLAMNHAIDGTSFIGTVLPKEAKPATQIVVPDIPGHNFEIDKRRYAYDPAKARQLLAQAKADGVPVDKEIMLFSYPVVMASATELMEAYHAQFKAVGLNMKLQALEAGEYAKYNTRPFPDPRPVAVLQTLHDNITGDPLLSLTTRYTCKGNNSVFCDDDIEKRVQKAASLEGAARAKDVEEIFRILHEDIVADVVLYHMVAFTLVNNRVRFVPDLTVSAEVRLEEFQFQ